MNAKQSKLIEQAATVETDGEGWRKRMEAWMEAKYGTIGTKSVMTYAQLKKACRVLVKNQANTPDFTAWMNQHDMAILWANRRTP